MAGTVREQVADAIKADNAAFIVKAAPVSLPENLAAGKTYISVYRDSLDYSPGSLTHNLKIVLIVAKQGTEAAETDLDGALDAVLLSIEAMPGVNWSTATRSTFAEKWQGYEIAASAASPNVYKSQLLQA